MRRVKILLDLPAQALMPNVSVHRMAKARATKEAREAAWEAACLAVGTDVEIVKSMGFPWKHATAQVTWKYCRLQPDRQNALSALKAAFDGFEDAGIYHNDRELVHMPVKMVKVLKGCEGVEIIVQEIAGDECPLCGMRPGAAQCVN